MYELKYNFQQYNQVISVYLESLINKSMIYFQNQMRNGQIINSENDSGALAGAIENIEEYLYYYFTKYPNNFNNILNSTMNNLRTIACLPSNQRGIYGETQAQNKIIYIREKRIYENYIFRCCKNCYRFKLFSRSSGKEIFS